MYRKPIALAVALVLTLGVVQANAHARSHTTPSCSITFILRPDQPVSLLSQVIAANASPATLIEIDGKVAREYPGAARQLWATAGSVVVRISAQRYAAPLSINAVSFSGTHRVRVWY